MVETIEKARKHVANMLHSELVYLSKDDLHQIYRHAQRLMANGYYPNEETKMELNAKEALLVAGREFLMQKFSVDEKFFIENFADPKIWATWIAALIIALADHGILDADHEAIKMPISSDLL